MKRAVDRIAEQAKRMANPLMSENGYLTVMAIGAELVLHDLEMGVLQAAHESGHQTMTVELVRAALRAQREAIRVLVPVSTPAPKERP